MKQEAVQPPVFRFPLSMKIIFTFRLYSASDCGDIINERNGSQEAGKRDRDERNAGEYIRIPSSGDGSSDGRNDGGNPGLERNRERKGELTMAATNTKKLTSFAAGTVFRQSQCSSHRNSSSSANGL